VTSEPSDKSTAAGADPLAHTLAHPALGGFGRGPDGRSTEISSRQGTPDWLAASLNYCSRCGARLAFGEVAGEDRERLACQSCGFIAYVNPRLVVTAIPVTDEGRVVLLRRGIEPGRGLWAQPGGFLEVDETVSEAAIRETFEETGLVIRPGEIVGLYSRLEAAVVVIAFEAHVVAGEPRTNPEALEIATFAPADIPWPEVAFLTSKWAIRDWIRLRRPDALPTTPLLPG
jgi:ADP-ribose pyrophosphatase YjhB (NUDIX family)